MATFVSTKQPDSLKDTARFQLGLWQQDQLSEDMIFS